MQNLFTQLNNAQREAIFHISGPTLVLAGAGSGKTRVIVNKILNLIKNEYQPKNIFAITFSNKAANEMNERLTKISYGINTKGINISTFHALGLKILRAEAKKLSYKTNFSILSAYDSNKIIADISNNNDPSILYELKTQFSLWKNNFIDPIAAISQAQDQTEFDCAKFYQLYDDTLKSYHAVDFDDLIKLPVDLFNTDLPARVKWQNKIFYLLVDEYQDTNLCQYQLLKTLVGDRANFTVVGDDDQSIYAWRGADVANISRLNIDYPQLKLIKLEQNYRSSSIILNAANSVISNNTKLYDKKLWSQCGQGELIKIIACKNHELEAEIIIKKIVLHQLNYKTKYSDYAILYRANHQSRIFEQILRNFKLPYQVSGSQSFFEKDEIKDLLYYLKLIVNEDDDNAFIRALTIPKKGVGQLSLTKLSQYAANREISLYAAIFEEGFASICNSQQYELLLNFAHSINNLQDYMVKQSVTDLLNYLLEVVDYENYLYQNEDNKTAEKKWFNIQTLIAWFNKKALMDNKTIAELVQIINLISILEGKDKKDIDAINLSTLHAAKGLEYPYVFLISCEEGIIPHQESIINNDIAEERRLMYVGITRAKYELVISYCEERKRNGETCSTERSRFISEIGVDNIIDETLIRFQKITKSEEMTNKLEQLQKLFD